MKYSTILFDLDGTLTDPEQGICGSVRYALEKAGKPVGPIESYHKYIGPPLLRSFEVYANATPEEAKQLLGFYRERFSTVGLFENEVYPGIPELLRQLRADGVVSAVVSNKPDYAVKTLSEQYFPGLLAASAGAKEGVRKKPCPDSVFEVVRQLGAEALRAVYIGDSEVDIETAKNAGMPCISVSWGFRDRDVLVGAGAGIICDDTDALYRALREG